MAKSKNRGGGGGNKKTAAKPRTTTGSPPAASTTKSSRRGKHANRRLHGSVQGATGDGMVSRTGRKPRQGTFNKYYDALRGTWLENPPPTRPGVRP